MTLPLFIYRGLLYNNGENPEGREMSDLFGLEGISNDLVMFLLALLAVLLLSLIAWSVKHFFFTDATERAIRRNSKNGNYDEVIRYGSEFLSKNPPSFFVVHAMAKAYAAQKKWEHALKFFNDASLFEAKNPKSKLYPSILMDIARIQEQMGKTQDAMATYHMILGRDENYAEALFELSETLYQQKKIKKAREHLEKLLAVKPGLLDARLLYGKILYETGSYDLSLKQFRLLERHDPKNGEVHYYKARNLENLKQYSSAIDAYWDCLDAEFVSRKMRESCQIHLIQNYIRLKRFREGLEEVAAFLREPIHPDTKTELLYLNANMLWNDGDEYQAVICYEKVFRSNPAYKDATIIYERYKDLIAYDSLAEYLTSDELQFEATCQKLIGSSKTELLYRSRDLYIFARGVAASVFYRHIDPPSFSKMTDIEILLNSYGFESGSHDFYSVNGIASEAAAHGMLKKLRVVERDEFFHLLKKAFQKDRK